MNTNRSNNQKAHSAGRKSGNSTRAITPQGANFRPSKKRKRKNLNRSKPDPLKWVREVEETVKRALKAPPNPHYDEDIKADFLDLWSQKLEYELLASGFREGDEFVKQIVICGRDALETASAFIQAMHKFREVMQFASAYGRIAGVPSEDIPNWLTNDPPANRSRTK